MLHGVHKWTWLKMYVDWKNQRRHLLQYSRNMNRQPHTGNERNIRDIISFFVVLEEKFQQLQQSFMEKHYLEFDDSDENKLSYTTIFNEYVSCWAARCFMMVFMILRLL